MTKRASDPLPAQVQVWVDARRRFRMSHAQVAMARELGLNPRKFGQLDNYRQEPWKAPLPAFIEDLYLKRFGRPTSETVASVEDRYRQEQRKRATRRDARAARRDQAGTRRPLGGLRAARPATSNDTPSTSRPRSEALSSRW